MSEKKNDWFLYLTLDHGLFRLDLEQFCRKGRRFPAKSRQQKPLVEFEKVRFPTDAIFPWQMQHIIVGNSQLFMVGGLILDFPIGIHIMPYPNLDVYSLNTNTEMSTSPSLTVWDDVPIFIPNFLDSRVVSTLENNPMVTTLEGKIYVLATTKLDMLDATHLFQVFDPSNLSWKHIPLPPKFLNNSSVISHTRWGCHKILTYTHSGSYVFDSRKEIDMGA